jgi:hypothetical protein
LKRSALAWALGRALRLAIGSGVVALILATTFAGAVAERLATAAYLAAIFAAIALVAQRFLTESQEPRTQSAPPFPSFLGYSVSVAILLSAAATLASQPGAEVVLVAACVALVVIAVLVRAGAFAALNVALARGSVLAAATRYAVVAGAGVLVLTALLPADSADGTALLAYRITVIATLLIGASLVAPTRVGGWVVRNGKGFVRELDRLAQALVFERTASFGAILTIALIVPASLMPAPFAEPFVIAAYLAAAVAAFGLAMECRRLRS